MIDPRPAVVEVNNFLYATSQLSQTTLRSVLGEAELDELLSEREKLNLRLQSILDQHTAAWGVKVSMVEEAGGSGRTYYAGAVVVNPEFSCDYDSALELRVS